MKKDVKSAGITGVGLFVSDEIRDNSYWDDKEFPNLPKRKSKEDSLTGIKERRMFPQDMIPSDAEAEAGKVALKNADIAPEEIDMIMVHSMVPDELTPGNASLVQHKLGLTNAAAWNLDTCCSSFVTMVIAASHLLALGTFKNILIITSVFHSKIVDENDYLSPLCGDAAGAVVMGNVEDGYGYLGSHSISDGYFHDAFTVRERMPYGVYNRRHFEPLPTQNLMTTNPSKVREMGRKSIDQMTPVMLDAIQKAGLNKEEIDFFLSHQPCHWAHDAWRKSLELDKDQSHQTFEIYGNIASTSIPASMYHAVMENKLEKGDNVLIASSGAGENHTAAVLKWVL
jgi:3-oxoacyl-[acyl-carrier-protein] synthase-3